MPDSRSPHTQWKKGPLPKDTWNWGAVVTDASRGGFFFADFMGDHVMAYTGDSPGKKRVDANEVVMYTNCIEMPPKE